MDIIKIIKSKFFICCVQFAVLMAATFPSHPTKAEASPSQSNSLSFACCCPSGEHRGRVRWDYWCSGQKAAQFWEGEGNQINSDDFLSACVRRVGSMVVRAGGCLWEEQSGFSHRDCAVISPYSPPPVMANAHWYSNAFFPPPAGKDSTGCGCMWPIISERVPEQLVELQ